MEAAVVNPVGGGGSHRLVTIVALVRLFKTYRSNSMNKSRWLHAAKSGNLEFIEQRLREGQNIETAGAWGRTALWTAAQAGHTEIVERLLAAGANPGAHHARSVPCRHLARATHAPRMHVVCTRHALPCMHTYHADVGDSGLDSNTPLHVATWQGNIEAVRQLLMAHANPNLRNWNGRTPLDHVHVCVVQSQLHMQQLRDELRIHGGLSGSQQAGQAAPAGSPTASSPCSSSVASPRPSQHEDDDDEHGEGEAGRELSSEGSSSEGMDAGGEDGPFAACGMTNDGSISTSTVYGL